MARSEQTSKLPSGYKAARHQRKKALRKYRKKMVPPDKTPQTIATEALTLLNARARGVEQISSSENQAPKKDEHLKKISSSKVPEEERAKALVLRSRPLPGNVGVGKGERGEEEREEKEGEADEEHEPCFGGVVASEEEKEKEDEEEGALSSDGQLPASVATDWNRGDFALALRFRRRSFEQRM